MKTRTILLAQQLLGSVPKDEIEDLVQLLQYYNRFDEADRVRAMQNGSTHPVNGEIETKVIREVREKSAGSQNVYMSSNQTVCRCCGR
jgi:hypothetical protein